MRSIFLVLSIAALAPAAWAQKPAEGAVCKARFEGKFNDGTRAEADAASEAAARRIFAEYASKTKPKAPPAGAAPGTAPPVLALDRVRRLADNCTGLQGFLVFP